MKLHHVAITVKDLEVSILFYEKFFGFKEIKRFRRDDMSGTGVFLQGENVFLELWRFDILKEGVKEDLFCTGIRHITFIHEELETPRNEFIKHGLNCTELKDGASGGRYFFLSDPDGNQIEVYQNKKLNIS